MALSRSRALILFDGLRFDGRQGGERRHHDQQHEDRGHAAVDDGPVDAALQHQADRERPDDRADGEGAVQEVHRPTGVARVHAQDRRIDADIDAALAEADQRAEQRVGHGSGVVAKKAKPATISASANRMVGLGPQCLTR